MTLSRKQIQNSQVRKRKRSKLKEELGQDVSENVPFDGYKHRSVFHAAKLDLDMVNRIPYTVYDRVSDMNI